MEPTAAACEAGVKAYYELGNRKQRMSMSAIICAVVEAAFATTPDPIDYPSK